MKEKVLILLENIAKELGFEGFVELTPSKGHGDFSTNLAMKMSRQMKKNPKDIALIIKEKIISDFIEEIEIAGPGFINLTLKGNVIALEVKKALEQKNLFGSSNQGKYINVEYVSANPTGKLHLGHARGAVVGSVLSNILIFAGNKVDQEYYVNDAGNQINILAISTFIRYQQEFGMDVQLPENSYGGEEIIQVAKTFKEKYGNKFVNSSLDAKTTKNIFRNETKDLLLEWIKKDLEDIQIKMDFYSSEQRMYDENKIDEALEKLKKHTFIEDGATWLDTISKGDDKNRVLIKKDKTFTYLTPDIAYHNVKLSRGYNELINIWGVDHIGYIKRIEVALNYLGLPSDKLDILSISLVKLLKNGKKLKMSKRAGTGFTIEDLVKITSSDIVRYFMASKAVTSNFSFDVEKLKEKTNDNPLFSIQYSNVRAKSILKKTLIKELCFEGVYSKKETDLINHLMKFGEKILYVANKHKVHVIPTYMLELSSLFNTFYADNKIIGNPREEFILPIVKLFNNVIDKCLELMGLTSPEKI
ncbi:MAG: arginine--tRNA ligase [Mollicutes bacterium PWAP]|nr:arginine--tRNA ligase [Mollicutes bacterium PWAP]